MRVLVVGGGAREHALCWKIKQSPLLSRLYCAPGNAGIEEIAECLPLNITDLDGIVKAAIDKNISFVVIGPEGPLANGLVDRLTGAGILSFGPCEAAAELESSKALMKSICVRCNIPTAEYEVFTEAPKAHAYIDKMGVPLVVKADGLASGKGVVVADTPKQAHAAIDEMMVEEHFGEAGKIVIIEEFLQGQEISFFALCDGKTAMPFGTASDYKRHGDGDTGPNTGGMGAVSPSPWITPGLSETIMETIIRPLVEAMSAYERPFQGVLFAGLMLTEEGPKLLEVNVRFGDPEFQALVLRLRSDLLAIMYSLTSGNLPGVKVNWSEQRAVCVVIAANGYPTHAQIGGTLELGKMQNSTVFHAGTRKADGILVPVGGRILSVAALGDDVVEARQFVYDDIQQINYPNGYHRRDIGQLPQICPRCRRNTNAPFFDGCMPGGDYCPYGFTPCL